MAKKQKQYMTISKLCATVIALTLGTRTLAQEYFEDRDLIPLCDSILEVTTDGYVAYKFAFTYDRFGGRTDSAFYLKRGDKWENHFHYTHERNEDGNITKSAYYNWDAKTEEWIPSGRMNEYYYDGTQKIGEAEYYWNTNLGKYDPKRKNYDYTVNGINTRIHYFVNSDHFELYSKTITAKTQTGKDSFVEEYLWHDSKNTWEGQYKSYHSYDKAGNLTETISYTWDTKTDAWRSNPTSKIEYTYDQENYCTAALRYQWNYQNECWNLIGRDDNGQREYEYDAEGRIVKIVSKFKDGKAVEVYAYDLESRETYFEVGQYYNNGDYYLIEKREHTYDNHGNLTMEYWIKEKTYGEYSGVETKSNYDYSIGHCETMSSYLKDGQWVEMLKTERDFDSQGRTLKEVTYDYDLTDQKWVGTHWHEFAYHANGYYSMQLSYSWDMSSDAWIGYEKYEYDFDAKGRQTVWAYYNRMSDDGKHWHPVSKLVSHYDNNDCLVKQEAYQSQSWSDDPFNWVHTWNYLYYYGGKTIESDAVTTATSTSVFSVYSLDGTLLYNGPSDAWHQPRHGIYIVRDGKRSYKVGH